MIPLVRGLVAAVLPFLFLGASAWPVHAPEPAAAPAASFLAAAPRASAGYEFELLPAPTVQLPGPVDSNSPSYWSNGTLKLVTSGYYQAQRSTGDSVADLDNPVGVRLPEPERPGAVWMESIWRDPASGILYGWYHFEPSDLECLTAPMIGAAISNDDGLTWQDRGFVITSAYDIDCDYDNGYFSGGSGDFSVVLGPQYLYFVFSSYNGPMEEQGVTIARGLIQDRGQPGTVFKYHDSSWSEPGLGGKATAVIPVTNGWQGPELDAFWGPSVHFNTYLGSYVALLNRTVGTNFNAEGVYISFSQDLVSWSAPAKVLETSYWYPEAIGLRPGETDSIAGQNVRLYIHGVSNYVLRFAHAEPPLQPGPVASAEPEPDTTPEPR